MPTDEHPSGKIREDHDTEQHIERFGYLVGGQKRCGDDEQNRDDIERKQGIAETNAFRRCAFVEVSNGFPESGKRHGAILTARAHHCK